MMSQKRKREEESNKALDDLFEDSDSQNEENEKTEENNNQNKKRKINHLINSNNEAYLELSTKRRITIRSWRGKKLIDIREYYEDKSSGEYKPGKKGISLAEDQWNQLKDYIETIDELLAEV